MDVKVLTVDELAAIEARYKPQELRGHYGLRALLLEVVASHKAQAEELAKVLIDLQTARLALLNDLRSPWFEVA